MWLQLVGCQPCPSFWLGDIVDLNIDFHGSKLDSKLDITDPKT